MKFGSVPLAEAEGAILAHGVRVQGRMLKKGHVLTAADLAAIAATGQTGVVVARIGPDDAHEDAAAQVLADALVGPGITLGKAFTGRVNLFAAASGVLVVDRERLDRINLADEAITLASLAPFARVEVGTMVATVKIIPFAAPRVALAACVALATESRPLLRVAPFVARDAGLILTRLPGTKEKVLDGTRAATLARLSSLGCRLADEIRCDHDAGALAAAIRDLSARGCRLILVYGASAITDRRDVIPAAVTAAGGTVLHLGMPVDPGNLLLLATLGDVPVLGLPGCARSLKLNGFDWVLERLVADVPVSPRDIMLMGAGGLLMEIPSRPLPRAEASPAAPPAQPRIAAVVLAAGQSRRMGATNKLLAMVAGRPMVAHAVAAALASNARPVIVVTGHEASEVRAALAGQPVTFADNPDYAAGLSTSLIRGLDAVPASCDGAVVCLGDMPRVSGALLDRLIAAFDPLAGRAIAVATHRAKRGNPVLLARRFFPEVRRIGGDVGARHLIGEHEDLVVEVESDDAGVLLDIDTPEALARTAR
ncbi:MAG: 4-diphosphocytidyl-2C-methyl-D-erythritol kinase [Alphaproteobacteria bacterium]|nr:4-diphosphocytidyl-2C-methyl-D-erythritol kinase [Alphaproteobacteria bacterium]